MNTNNSYNGIHYKIAHQKQFRRFLFFGTDYLSLYNHVKTVLCLEKPFVLNYTDNDGDLVIVSSDAELIYAISLAGGNILRLSIDDYSPDVGTVLKGDEGRKDQTESSRSMKVPEFEEYKKIVTTTLVEPRRFFYWD